MASFPLVLKKSKASFLSFDVYFVSVTQSQKIVLPTSFNSLLHVVIGEASLDMANDIFIN